MMEERNIYHELHLTGSNFFDTVIRLRAHELQKKYPELHMREENGIISFSGALPLEKAREFENEVN